MKREIIAPSILAADFANFQKELARIEETSAEYVHIDIMDGHFVPVLTFGPAVVAAMRPHSKLVFDCHMMVERPEDYIAPMAQAGVDIMTIHVEATRHLHGALQKIKAAGMKAGVVMNPGTPVTAVEPVLDLVDQVLVMTVNPGFGGQAYLPAMADKVRQLAAWRTEKGLSYDIEVDGGIDNQTIAHAKAAGANVFVAGSFVFKQGVSKGVAALETALSQGTHN